MSLYDRQKDIKMNSDLNITIVGVGGIGHWVALYSAMSGIKELSLFDPDLLEDHNRNRLLAPPSLIGKNKTEVVARLINNIRPECSVHPFPFKFTGNVYEEDTDWFVDCTDNIKSQEFHSKFCREKGFKYVKAGYDGTHITISNVVAEWGEAEDGYTITPSWVVPASVVAALTVAKIMKYENKELSTDIKELYR